MQRTESNTSLFTTTKIGFSFHNSAGSIALDITALKFGLGLTP